MSLILFMNEIRVFWILRFAQYDGLFLFGLLRLAIARTHNDKVGAIRFDSYDSPCNDRDLAICANLPTPLIPLRKRGGIFKD